MCRRWRSIVHNQTKNRLCLHFGPYPLNKKWSFTPNQLIGYRNSIEVKSINLLGHQLTRTYFKHLKQLNIFNIYSHEVEVTSLHRFSLDYFKELEQLELNGIRLTNDTSFNLKCLRTLVLKNVYIDKQLKLNCPRLTNFVCDTTLSRISIEHPETIKIMHCSAGELHLKFENLEQLNFNDLGSNLQEGFLNRVPNLRKLILYSYIEEEDFNRLKQQRRMYGLDDLKILHFGFDEQLGFMKCRFGLYYYYNHMLHKNTLPHVADNYSRLDYGSPWPVRLYYTDLIETFKVIPEDFLRKFTNLYQLDVTNLNLIDGQNAELIAFIRKCAWLNILSFENCLISQEFLDQLHLHVSITTLKFVNQTDLIKFNFSFLDKLNAVCLSLGRECKLPVKLLDYLFNLTYFKYIMLEMGFVEILHIELDQNKFHVWSSFVNGIDKKFNLLSNLIRYLRRTEPIKNYLD